MNNLTKVTIEFPNGNKESFETVGMIGGFVLEKDARGANMGAFATGQFTQATAIGLATGIIEAVAKEMMNQGMPQEGVIATLAQILPHAVGSAAVREIDAHMSQLENEEHPMVKAIAELLNMK